MKYTASLLALNLMVFAAYALPLVDDPYGMINLVMGNEPAGVPVDADEIWPGLATYMWGHLGVAHLAMNMIMLAMAGRGLEEKAGVRIIPIYLAGGAIGALAHLTWSGMFSPGLDASLIGASAAVSGVFGGACIYRTISVGGIIYFVLVLNILPVVAISTGIFGDDGVSYVSHVGGMAAGLVLGACFAVAGRVARRTGVTARTAVDPEWATDIARSCGRQAVH